MAKRTRPLLPESAPAEPGPGASPISAPPLHTATYDLPPDERRRLLDAAATALATFPSLRLAWTFGSFTRPGPFRDLDLGVVLDTRSWRLPARIGQAVWEAVGRPAWDVDVVVLDAPGSHPRFRRQVADDGLLLREREPRDAVEFWLQATSELADLREWQRVHGVTEGAA